MATASLSTATSVATLAASAQARADVAPVQTGWLGPVSSAASLSVKEFCPPASRTFAQPPTALAARAAAAKSRLASTSVIVRAALGVEPRNVLILNTDSGGHAVIGFWLAKRLKGFGHKVTVVTVGEEGSPKMDQPPFSRFNELREVGVRTLWGNPSDLGAVIGGSEVFDAVLDNNGKDLGACKPVVDWAFSTGVKQYLFVSSAGIYKSGDEPPHVEGDAVKSDAGHVQVEQYIASLSWPNGWAAFRPQYITGSGNNKDCEEWFFDRIVRGRPVPIPAPGLQLTVITHAADISDMIVAAINDPEAAGCNVFNAVSGRAVTFDGLVRLCAKAAGMEANIVHYDPKAVGVDAKKAFPFRNMHFYSEPRKARELLGWVSELDLAETLDARFEEYVSTGRYEKELTFELDDKILAAVGK